LQTVTETINIPDHGQSGPAALSNPIANAPAGLRRIGAGLQYTVYDLGNGRVFKRPASNWECYARMFAWRFPFRKIKPWKLPDEVARIRADAARSLERIKPLLPRVGPSLGNPMLHDRLCYEQDRATVLEDYFRNHTLGENKAVVDQYIALLFHLWGQGFNDGPFKFTLNFGMDPGGKVILLDLGELYFEKEKALERIRVREWERTQIPDAALDAYYRRAMNAAMTIANVEIHWRPSIACQ
jgi:hypothetical protein